ncbi:NUDIX hydrolase [Streptococcus ictaluri]|uniref:Hydrolase, NUDIX family n=1 Tax=Streptococcus ictaluri 707-05 TaxID=764299 RepID=G5K0N7_9STRE|nr:NUDIX domain-containing protein [Streptococcus ictaluri]EHI70459.1 hydrolase, NUDIX family [Streptococcus ictaluri 707-05]
MVRDFRVIEEDCAFGLRASALIIKDNQIFLTKDQSGYYYTIGGASLVGETTRETVLRETLEEIGISVEVGPLAFVVENQFYKKGRLWHNIECHYFVTPLTDPNLQMSENDKTQICEWVALDQLSTIKLVPEFLKEGIINWPGHIVHVESSEIDKS